tara:strand:- start:89 stop:571 length:483 start_codon:yes stop_codon:yes gene_type:complete
MALSKLDKTSEDHKMLETYPDEWAVVLRDLIDKVNTGFDKTNEHINKVASMQSEINTEKNKTGITQAQADAIVANTAKTGITSTQATAIANNTAQAKSLANEINTLNLGVQQNVATSDKRITAIVIPRVNIAKSGITLDLTVRLSDGGRFITSLPLTAQK